MKSRPLTCTVGIAMVGIAILAGTFGSTSCAPRPRPGVVPGAPEPPPLTGFADLHAHPTAHLTMGHRPPDGSCPTHIGLFHGLPGDSFDPAAPDATILEDLGTCDVGDHAHCPSHDAVKEAQRAALLALFEDAHNNHTQHGADSFASWPSANSRLHQQMHLKWLHRAYQGGLRLLIASMTNNELVSKY
jgi:hypothetical protein